MSEQKLPRALNFIKFLLNMFLFYYEIFILYKLKVTSDDQSDLLLRIGDIKLRIEFVFKKFFAIFITYTHVAFFFIFTIR
jgi:hypothetical protein